MVSARQRLSLSEWLRVIPFIGLHLACGAVWLVGVSNVAMGIALATFYLRVFALTAFYHRYFSHRAFKTSRWFQFLGALIGTMATQRGPLWWAAHHRDHHRYSDQMEDVHSPHTQGFWWAHMGWFIREDNFHKSRDGVRDFFKYPELLWIDRYDLCGPAILISGLYFLGEFLANSYPRLSTSGLQLVVWGYVISTVALYHTTYAINSLAHTVGSRRYVTSDDSRNNWLLALLTWGEGWHNNHHHYPSSARQGFFWWEIDMTYYVLRLLATLGIVWDLREVPWHVQYDTRRTSASRTGGMERCELPSLAPESAATLAPGCSETSTK